LLVFVRCKEITRCASLKKKEYKTIATSVEAMNELLSSQSYNDNHSQNARKNLKKKGKEKRLESIREMMKKKRRTIEKINKQTNNANNGV